LRNKWPEKKNLLAKPIHSDTKAGGVSPGSISRNYERRWDASAYDHFERLFRPVVRGLPFTIPTEAQSVQFIHNHQAQNGDTITLPSGRFSWTGTVSLTKAIILKGQTIRNDDGTSIDNTIIQDNIPLSANNGLIELKAPGGRRVTGITFVQGRTQLQNNGIIRVSGTTPTRIDHCVFDHVYFSPMINVGDYNYGVIDHNTRFCCR
jgi:hypothetical protein